MTDTDLLATRVLFAHASTVVADAITDAWRAMDRLTSALADLERKDDAYRAAHLAAIIPVASTPITSDVIGSPVPVPQGVPILLPSPTPQTPRFRYAPGQLRASVLAIYRSVEECSLKEALAHLRVEHPRTKMESLRASIFDLVTDGYLQHGEQRGVYRLTEPKRPLSMVQ